MILMKNMSDSLGLLIKSEQLIVNEAISPDLFTTTTDEYLKIKN